MQKRIDPLEKIFMKVFNGFVCYLWGRFTNGRINMSPGIQRIGKMKRIGRFDGVDHDLVTWLSSVVFVLGVTGSLLFGQEVIVESMVIRENPVRLRVLEYSSKNGSLARVLNSRYSDLVVGEEVEESSQLVLECSSRFGPLRWIYSGVGKPDHKSYYTSRTRSDSTASYTAYLSFPNGLSSKDTGQYSCQNSYNSSLNNYVYIFVPKKNTNGKPSLFVPTDKKHDVVITPGQTTARIPCGVVHPNVKVSLERVSPQKSFWLETPTAVPYSPKTGFTVPVSPTTKEIYTCRGEYNGEFEEVTFVTSPVQPRIDSEVEHLHDILHHNQHRHRPTGSIWNHTKNVATTTTTIATTSTTQESTSASTTPTNPTSSSVRPKLPSPEKHLVSACTPQYCGSNAECIVKDYKPYCVCLEDYTGDPNKSCHKISDHSQHLRVEDPCHPSPCGKNSECLQINGHPLCTCLEGFYGTPPKCSPHKFHNCTKNYDCEWTEYCNTDTKKCEDICEGSTKFCGKNALCTAFSHMPYCTCPPGGSYVGDPYDTEGSGCQLQSERTQVEGKPSCNPSPCGRNAHCKVYSSYPLPICFCPQGFTGDPSHRCYKLSPAPIIDVFRPHYNTHPPLSTTTTTSTTLAPFSTSSSASFLPSSGEYSSLLQHHYPNSRPVTLCTPEFCGENARCRFRNNHPECHCLSGYKGDPYKACFRQAISPVALRQACSVCGPNSVCSMISSDVRCICAPDTIGSPPNCKRLNPHPSASSLSSSSTSSSSHSQQHHQVSVVSTSHSTSSFSSTLAHHIHRIHQQQLSKHHLQVRQNFSSFSFLNTPEHLVKNFHPACTSDLDCPDDLVCYTAKQKCLNPCSWACSDSASCIILNHHVQCRCPSGFKGDPRVQCTRQRIKQRPLPTPTYQPQSESDKQQAVPENHTNCLACGPHTVCRRVPPAEMRELRRKAFSMESLEMEKDPLQRALLIQIKRVVESNDPKYHINSNNPMHYFTECMCMRGAVGNPYSIEGCFFSSTVNSSIISSNSNDNDKIFSDDLEPIPSSSSNSIIIQNPDPCKSSSGTGKSPCGPHSLCVPYKGQAFCRCDYDSVGEPPNCMLRCGKDQHCLFDQVCLHGRCVLAGDDNDSINIKQGQHNQQFQNKDNLFDNSNSL